MEITPLGIEGSWVAQSPIWGDERGFFREWFKLAEIETVTGRSFSFEQANVSSSSKGVVRGIHYSVAERGQAKWVTCVNGSIIDFVVDIRPNSETFGRWLEIDLSEDSGKAVLIGEGLGHAFLSLSDKTTVVYLLSSPYSPLEEFTINPLDPIIGIDWKIDVSNMKISDRDRFAPSLSELKEQGMLPNRLK